MNHAARHELATMLATLRREHRARSGLDARLVPPDKAAAYEVAALVAVELGWPVVGWKIAAAKAEMQRQLRTDAPIYGRVLAPGVVERPATFEHARLVNPIPELEYIAILGRDLPPRPRPYTEHEIAEAVAAMHVGVEVAECRFTHDPAFPPLAAILADGSGSGTLVRGPAIADWRHRDIAGQEVVLLVDGVARRRGNAGDALDHPLVPLTWLANELSRTGVGMKAGEAISTGTLTGMLKPKKGERHLADFGPFGSVEVLFA